MKLFLAIILFFNKYLISTQEYFILLFTCLAIFVTLIAISSSLTKEVRQDLFRKYYLTSLLIRLYLDWLIISFLISIAVYYCPYIYSYLINTCLLIITFFWTVIFIWKFLQRLNRGWLYEKLFEEFKKEIKLEEKKRKSGRRRKTRDNLNYSKFQYKSESLDSLFENISYIQNNGRDFIEEINCLKKCIEYYLDNERLDSRREYIFKDFLRINIENINDTSFYEALVNMFIGLILKKPDNLKKVRFYQQFLYRITVQYFYRIESFNTLLNTTGYYLKWSLHNNKYIKEFKIRTDNEWIEDFKLLVESTIKSIFDLCKNIINLDLRLTTKHKYLKSQIGSLSQTLSGLDYLTGTDFCDDYNSLQYGKALTEPEQRKLNLANLKLNIIMEQQQYLNNCLLELFFLILLKIDQGELSKSYFELAYNIYSVENVKTQYYKNNNLSELNWQTYNRYETGAQFIKPFNYNKYRLLILFYEYIEIQKLNLDKFEKELFSESSRTSFSIALEEFGKKFVAKYFDFSSKNFKEFKLKAKQEIEQKIGKTEKAKTEYIIVSALKKKYVDQFEEDCKDAWKQGDDDLKKFLKRKQIYEIPEKSNFFGQYFLFKKKWLIDPFENDVEYGRDSGKHYGQSQASSKRNFILKQIFEMYDNKKDKEFILKDISTDLLSLIDEGKEYFFFYNQWELTLGIPNLNWINEGMIRASLDIKNSKINFCFTKTPCMMMFEKNAFILKQCKSGYDDKDEELFVGIDEIKDEKEFKQIISDDNGYQTSDDVKQMVKIRIAERFEVVRNSKKPKSKLVRLKI